MSLRAGQLGQLLRLPTRYDGQTALKKEKTCNNIMITQRNGIHRFSYEHINRLEESIHHDVKHPRLTNPAKMKSTSNYPASTSLVMLITFYFTPHDCPNTQDKPQQQ
ncbi:hypothetical protein OIU84_014878 [Salix udensis]|uniref:Uncharacterized protein n=1 Tax=Salix udensis TaxID=889485 RepID=A0AAD6JDW7_9ROSI|nr:hypothetical protein OIU84_014878 [Salix udensis]